MLQSFYAISKIFYRTGYLPIRWDPLFERFRLLHWGHRLEKTREITDYLREELQSTWRKETQTSRSWSSWHITWTKRKGSMTMNANADKIFSLRSTRDRHVRTLHKSVALSYFYAKRQISASAMYHKWWISWKKIQDWWSWYSRIGLFKKITYL